MVFSAEAAGDIETASKKRSSKELKKLLSEKSNLKNGKRRDGMPKEGKGQTEGSTSSGGRISASPRSLKEKRTRLMPKRHWHSGGQSIIKKQVKGGERTGPSAMSSTERNLKRGENLPAVQVHRRRDWRRSSMNYPMEGVRC